MNNKVPNADNARLVLHSPFDIKVHKQTFINYLEVVISPEGVVEYAVPSHSEKLLQIYMEKNAVLDRGVALNNLSKLCGLFSYIEALSKVTGYISVWNDAYITGCKPTQQQLNKLKTLIWRQTMVKYRPHRGLLSDAMAEMKTFDTVDEMLEYIASRYSDYLSKEDLSVSDDLGKDHRIDWKETRYVCTKRFGSEKYAIPQCIGMCSIE